MAATFAVRNVIAAPPGGLDANNLRVWNPKDEGIDGLPAIRDDLQNPPHQISIWDPKKPRDGAVHFFTEDYRYERIWNSPTTYLANIRERGTAITPDFSNHSDTPLIQQRWNIYRGRWLGAYWQRNGIPVIPNAQWSGSMDLDYAFEGLPDGGMIAVSCVGMVTLPENRRIFEQGVDALLKEVRPRALLLYGRADRILGEPPDHCYVYHPDFRTKIAPLTQYDRANHRLVPREEIELAPAPAFVPMTPRYRFHTLDHWTPIPEDDLTGLPEYLPGPAPAPTRALTLEPWLTV